MSTETLQAQRNPTKVVILENPTLEELKQAAHNVATTSARFRLFSTVNGKRHESRKEYHNEWPVGNPAKIDRECESMFAMNARAVARFDKETKPNSEA